MTCDPALISTAAFGRSFPKYLKVKSLISDQIRSGQMVVGDRIPSLRQLVETSGISASTCQKAINSLIDDGVLEGQQGRGVFVRSTFGRSDVQQIALVAWSDAALAQHPAFNATINGLMRPLAASAYQLNFCFLDPARLHAEEMQARIAQIHAAGIVITHTPHAVQEALLSLTHKQVPMVAVGRPMQRLTPYAVLNNAHEALHRAVWAALEADLWPMALIGSPIDDVFERRMGVFQQCFEAQSRKLDELIVRRGPASYASGEQLMRELLASDQPPRLVFADDDYVAYGARSVLREHGVRVPEDMQMLGIGGFLNASLSLAEISILSVPFSGMGEMAGHMIMQLIDGHTPTEPMPVAESLIDTRRTFSVPKQPEVSLFNECASQVRPVQWPISS